MPVTKSASKKLRKDRKRELQNKKQKNLLKNAFKKALKNPSTTNIIFATKLVDKAAKNRIIHKNKAGRFKSKLAKVQGKQNKKTATTESRKKGKRRNSVPQK